MSGDQVVIEARGRVSPLVRWRDRVLAAVIWGAWAQPVWAVARRAGSGMAGFGADAATAPPPRAEMFLVDVVQVGAVACGAVVLLVATSAYRGWRDRR